MTEALQQAAESAGEPEETTERGGMTRRNAIRIGAAGAMALGIAGGHGLLAPELSTQGLANKDGVFTAASIAWADSVYDEVFPTSPLILSPFVDPLPIPKALAPKGPTGLSVGPPPSKAQQNSLNNQTHQIYPPDLGLPAPIVYEIDVKWGQHDFTTSLVRPIDKDGNPAHAYSTTGADLGTADRKLPSSVIWAFNGTFPGPMINAEYGKPALVRFVNQLNQNPLKLDGQDFGDPDGKFLTHLHNGHTAPESDGNPHYAMRFGPKAEGYSPGMWVDNLYLNYPAGGLDTEKQSFFWFHDHTDGMTGANVYKGMVGLFPIYDPKNGTDMGDETKGLRLPGVRTNNANGTFDVAYDIPLALYDTRLDDGTTLHHDFHDSKYPAAGNPRSHPEWWGKTFFRHFPNHGFVGDVFTVNGTAYPTLTVSRRKYRLRFLDASISRIYELQLMKSATGAKSAISLGLKGDTEMQGQYRLTDGVQSIDWTEIATDGGLLPKAFKRSTFELWPAKRREMVVDFTKDKNGNPTKKGDVFWLTNVMQMPNGRIWSKSTRFSSQQTAAAAAKGQADPIPNAGAPSNPAAGADSTRTPAQFAAQDAQAAQANQAAQPAAADGASTGAAPGAVAAKGSGNIPYQVPLMKIVIGDDAVDNSVDPIAADGTARALRPLPPLPADWKSLLANRKIFELQRGGSAGGETEWLINGQPFNANVVATSLKNDAGNTPLAQQKKDSFALWEIKNGGGGWVHPMHMHMEEHRVVMRNGNDVTVTPDPGHPDDQSREDLVALDPGESVIFYRGFRDFVGPYVAHCHNLAHEDHAMMFGWEITP